MTGNVDETAAAARLMEMAIAHWSAELMLQAAQMGLADKFAGNEPRSAAELAFEYGMRHRAAVGLTERTDAVVVVVSEERGAVSVCSNGRMVPNLDDHRLSRQLHRLFDLDMQDTTEPSGAASGGERRAS